MQRSLGANYILVLLLARDHQPMLLYLLLLEDHSPQEVELLLYALVLGLFSLN